jgi:hypothetical protein
VILYALICVVLPKIIKVEEDSSVAGGAGTTIPKVYKILDLEISMLDSG